MNERSYFIRFATDALKLAANPKFVAPCVAGAFMLIVGTILGLQYSFNMAAVLFAVPVASYLLASLSHRGLNVTREPVPRATEGETVEFRVNIKSSGISPRLGIKVTDELPQGLELVDGSKLYAALCTEDSVTLSYLVRPLRRGIYSVGPIALTSKDPIGVFEHKASFGNRGEFVVYPRPQPVALRMFLGTERFRSGDSQNTGRKGQGMELHGVREYAPGDDIRRIHWKTTARKGDLIVTEQESGITSEVNVVIDTKAADSSQKRSAALLDTATRLAAYAADMLLKHGFVVKLVLSHGKDVLVYTARTQSEIENILYPLAGAAADSRMSLAEVLAGTGITAQQTYILITSKVDQSLISEVLKLIAEGAQVNLVAVRPAGGEISSELMALLQDSSVPTAIVEGGTESVGA